MKKESTKLTCFQQPLPTTLSFLTHKPSFLTHKNLFDPQPFSLTPQTFFSVQQPFLFDWQTLFSDQQPFLFDPQTFASEPYSPFSLTYAILTHNPFFLTHNLLFWATNLSFWATTTLHFWPTTLLASGMIDTEAASFSMSIMLHCTGHQCTICTTSSNVLCLLRQLFLLSVSPAAEIVSCKQSQKLFNHFQSKHAPALNWSQTHWKMGAYWPFTCVTTHLACTESFSIGHGVLLHGLHVHRKHLKSKPKGFAVKETCTTQDGPTPCEQGEHSSADARCIMVHLHQQFGTETEHVVKNNAPRPLGKWFGKHVAEALVHQPGSGLVCKAGTCWTYHLTIRWCRRVKLLHGSSRVDQRK